MGYTTDFEGYVSVDPPLNIAEITFLHNFAESRRMNRDHGPYYVEGDGFHGQDRDPDIIDYNSPPPGQPGLWCQWIPTPTGEGIIWDGGEKFYHAAKWMKYLIEHFLEPGAKASQVADPQFVDFTFDHRVDGEIEAQGEDPNDRWKLIVSDNVVAVAYQAQIQWEEPRPV